MPGRLRNHYEALIRGLIGSVAGADRAAAANIEERDEHRRIRMIGRMARQLAATLPGDAQHPRAFVLPGPVLNPKPGTIAVLNVESVDAHVLCRPLFKPDRRV